MPTRLDQEVGLTNLEPRDSQSPRDLPALDMGSSGPIPDAWLRAVETLDGVTAALGKAEGETVATDRPGTLWLNGDALMCACPECGAPMSVRLWLMIADCWNCGTSIELTEEQEREARRLLAERGAEQPRKTDGPPRAAPTATRALAAPPIQSGLPPTRVRPATGARKQTVARAVEPRSSPRAAERLAGFFQDLPAWLVSLVFHLVLLTLLGLFRFGDAAQGDGPFITLSTAVRRTVREGGDRIVVDPRRELAFDLPVPEHVNLDRTADREMLVRADQDARELRIDPAALDPLLPDLETVKQRIRRSDGVPTTLASRDPRVRVEVVAREGGTTLTEAAVARGLRWLDHHQNDDGRWSLHAFNRSPGCTCSGSGTHSDVAGTTLALLPFLGAGQTHLVGRYRDTVSRGLRWLIDQQEEDGDLRGRSEGNTGMYAHGQAAIVLCEAFLMTGDEALRMPAQKAVDFIVAAQHPAGGWRYSPGQAGDTSVLGWQLMALQSARAANLRVPTETLELAGQYLDSVATDAGARYAYQPGQPPTHVMTAEALLCRLYLGWDLSTPGLIQGARFLAADHPPDRRQVDFYYWYYASQTLHHVGGDVWDAWNRSLRDVLVETQERRGHTAGSWDPDGPHASAGGRIYVTSLAICSLEVYYRHLPIFRQLQLD